MSIKENKINKFNSEKIINKNINKSRNLKEFNKFNTIGYISNSTKLPNLSNLKRNSLSKNNFNNTANNLKNDINNYYPKISLLSKFKKLNSFSPLNTNKIRLNYFNEISDKKINFSSLKKSNTIKNLKIQSNIFKKLMHNYNNNIYNNKNNNKIPIQLYKKNIVDFIINLKILHILPKTFLVIILMKLKMKKLSKRNIFIKMESRRKKKI